jgi:HEAT repeat protein
LVRVLGGDEYAFVREVAAAALGRFETPAVRAALEEAATRDPEPRVRQSASLALRD